MVCTFSDLSGSWSEHSIAAQTSMGEDAFKARNTLGRTPPGSPPKMAESVLTGLDLNHTDDSHDTEKTEAESGNGRDALDETREILM